MFPEKKDPPLANQMTAGLGQDFPSFEDGFEDEFIQGLSVSRIVSRTVSRMTL